MTFVIEALRTLVLIYALYLILAPLPGVLFPGVWREMANGLAKQSEAHIRKRSTICVLLGFGLFMITRI